MNYRVAVHRSYGADEDFDYAVLTDARECAVNLLEDADTRSVEINELDDDGCETRLVEAYGGRSR